jgi:hypothetical protein
MKTKEFECANCDAEGVIKFVGNFTGNDVAYCPFCSADIQNTVADEEDDDGDLGFVGMN